ncbi:MAG: glycoside hydrolase family 2 TIM barrel-domain containing protein, partial [Fibrobacter sp.]|nr:glycoside hydrolase family 2 TIM barrel-domain containing protein [Fibrobacter sp.]
EVAKESSNKSVNDAERRADWWLFGGIYRPVYLVAVPKVHIKHIAVNAQSDGRLTVNAQFLKLPKGAMLRSSLQGVHTREGLTEQEVKAFQPDVRVLNLTQQSNQTLEMQWTGVKPWDCEHPNLYDLKLELIDKSGRVLHSMTERIGFRSIEFKKKDGLYLNGVKLLVKGTNRHCFHPDGGRTLNEEVSLKDARLIKEMNMNAVRCHYPSDEYFLSMCDSLGLLYLEELAGWQNCYDDVIGRKLLTEMVERDVNHPCVFIWSNGNEGGFNYSLDSLFTQLDPQRRHVIHPWADFDGLDTHHYPSYQTGVYRLANGQNVFMPTEFLHGQYDKGQGAGLQDFWDQYTASPLFAGGFLWCFLDEAVKRTDKNGKLDSDGPNGPDGIVGPYREKEASFYTVREVWSPIQIVPFKITSSFKGEFCVKNSFLFTKLGDCSMKYNVLSLSSPIKEPNPQTKVVYSGKVNLPNLRPGACDWASFELPPDFFAYDVLELVAYNRLGDEVCRWTYSIKRPEVYVKEQFQTKAENQPTKDTQLVNIAEEGMNITFSTSKSSVSFDKSTGMLAGIKKGNTFIPFNNGPLSVGMTSVYQRGYVRKEGESALFIAHYTGGLDSIVWRMEPTGLLRMDAVMLNRPDGGGLKKFFENRTPQLGLTFSFPEEKVKRMKWFGSGPYRVWKNRLKGTLLSIWSKDYNNTVTGESFESLIYPEFKGYHANLYWATMVCEDFDFTVYSETDALYYRVFTPQEPVMRRDGANTMQDFPAGDLSFLLEIPAIQSYKPIPEQGPNSQPPAIRIKPGDDGFRIKLLFDFTN